MRGNDFLARVYEDPRSPNSPAHRSASHRRFGDFPRRELRSRAHSLSPSWRETEVLDGHEEGNCGMADALATRLDSFGCIPYESRYNLTEPPDALQGGGGGSSSSKNKKGGGGGGVRKKGKAKAPKSGVLRADLDIPWQLREPVSDPGCSYFDFLGTKNFWFLIQFSARVTFIGMLVPAVIIAVGKEKLEFMSSSFTLPAVVLAADVCVGGSLSFTVAFLKAACIWLPLATACAAVELHRSYAAFIVVYFVLLFLIACFTRDTTQRVALVLFNVSLVSQMNGKTALSFPSHILVHWLVGVLFGVASTLLPYPVLATRMAQSTSHRICVNAATAFRGLLTCFWAASNTSRSMGMVRIRHVTRSIDVLLDKLGGVEKLTFYEFLFFDSFERRKVRLEKTELLDQLRLNLHSMSRLIDIVQDNPHIIDGSSHCIQFGASLSHSMEGISRAVEELLGGLAEARSRRELLELNSLFEACGRNFKNLQDEFNVASRELFYEKRQAKAMGEFVPLMSFFVFSVVNFWSALDEFHRKMRTEGPNLTRFSPKRLWDLLTHPFLGEINFLKRLVLRHGEAELRVLIEAGKVSVAMLISMLFLSSKDTEFLTLAGPTITAFLSGVNPVQVLQGSVARLGGTLFGTVVGFFAASLCKTTIDFIASLCVITAVMTFFRTGEKYGPVCMSTNFIGIPSLAGGAASSAEVAIGRIQQNTFAVVVYCLILVLVFPVSPGRLLMKKRMHVLQTIAEIMDDTVDFYREPLHNEPQLLSSRREPGAQEPRGGGENEVASAGVYVSTFIKVPEPDARISNLFNKVRSLRQEMAQTARIMPFAADERGIKPVVYPQKACEAVHTALYRISNLVYNMVCSWKLMRDKAYFTPEMRRLFYYIYPVARDVQHSLQRFVNLLSFYVTHPSSSLASELTSCLVEFRVLVGESSRRKHRAILATITAAVRRQRQRQRENEARHPHLGRGAGHSGEGGAPPNVSDPSGKAQETGNATPAAGRPRSRQVGGAGEAAPPPALGRQRPNEPLCAAGGREKAGQRGGRAGERASSTEPTCRPGEEAVSELHSRRGGAAAAASPGPAGSVDAVWSGGGGGGGDSSTASSSHGSVHFSASFATPITVPDTEGIHAIALTLDMMGKELKNALLAFEDMVQLKTN
ncbi:uncharacterized protein Tco025E_04673 [Trypanosoma conorhini]|uniref:Integral membrane bound transporter domain-containing protein n=1 Tax=Trypanosoma conorhini TaxID=83891 RepID=A0A422PJX4_9TRYP|nr:uncharacterized protein Tco025E_04673 [Trypanosoma conorhini]RNF18014.1 hypothetical protein Tco025E_04673 [Trypanosoma conorhini]